MTTQPDPAAANYRANFLWGKDDDELASLGYEFVNAKTQEYRQAIWQRLLKAARAELEGRALAEAVLEAWTQTHKCDVRDIDEHTHIDHDDWTKIDALARAYLKALDGSQDASRRVGDQLSSDSKE